MKVFFHLLKIYVASAFNLKNIKAQIQKRKIQNGETVTKNSTMKIIGIAILFLLLIAEIAVLFGFYVYSLYQYAKAMNNIKLLFEVSTVLISLITLFFGFLVTASTYYIGEIEEQFLSMPIKPRTLCAAKCTATYLNSLITSVIFFALVMIIYGIYERPAFLFYLWGICAAVLIPLPMIGIAYFCNILLMRFTRIFKNKNVITTISASLGIILSLGFNYLIQSTTSSAQDLDAMAQKIATGSAAVETFGSWYLPVKLTGSMLANPASYTAVLNFFLLALCTLVIPATVIFCMSELYAKSLVGFTEKKVKRLEAQEVSGYIQNNIKSLPPLVSYVKREFIMMNRNPMYLLNGPFVIVFMPILMIVIFAAKGLSLHSIPPEMFAFMSGNAGFVVAGLAAGFLGSMSNIADTALSRDAKFIPMIKSLPVDMRKFMYAKFIHAMIFVIVATVICVGFTAYLFKFTMLQIILSVLTALAISALLNLIALFLDTVRPKLHWDNPIAAMKQNGNVAFVMLFNFLLMGLSALLLYFAWDAAAWLLAVYFILIPAAIFGVLIKPYGMYAERKLNELEV